MTTQNVQSANKINYLPTDFDATIAKSKEETTTVASKVKNAALTAIYAIAQALRFVVNGLANVLVIAPINFIASKLNKAENTAENKAETESKSVVELPAPRSNVQWAKDGVSALLSKGKQGIVDAKNYVLSTRVANFAKAHPYKATGIVAATVAAPAIGYKAYLLAV